MTAFKDLSKKVAYNAKIQALSVGLNGLSYFAPGKAGSYFLDILTTPQTIPFSDQDRAFLATAKQQDLWFNDLNIRCYHWPGSKPGVLLAHGWESHSARWTAQIKALMEKGHEVVALDAPAHGQSGSKTFTGLLYADFLNVVINHYQPQTLIGHSAGGMASAFLLRKALPISVKKLALLATPARLMDLILVYQKALNLNDKVIEGLDNTFIQRYQAPISDFSIVKAAKLFQVPGLVIHDPEDNIAPYQGALTVHHNWKGSKMISTKNLGHSLYGKEVVETLVDFVSGPISA